ncbi:MAG: hypothetical protein GY707_16630, partial [Desulfobacteraceae bacterium]|nr:hypothetical protein [Desulfobacteraceae bacterium]
WTAIPKAGDTIGSSAMINIFVKNKGIAASGASKVQITLISFSGGYRPPSLSGTLHIPPLNAGQSFILSWPQLSSAKWPSGRFQFNFEIDPQNQIKESKETNNKDHLFFEIAPLKGNSKYQLKKNKKARKIKSMSQPSASQASNITGLSIISPKPNTRIYGGKTHTIKYFARGAEKIDIDYLIYRLDEDGNPKDTFKAKSIIENEVPTGSCDIHINRSMVPISKVGYTDMQGNRRSRAVRHDGKVAIRLKAVINGKEVERIYPLTVRIPGIRLIKPKSGSDLYRGQRYEARWSTRGYSKDTVQLELFTRNPEFNVNIEPEWSIEVPNTGRYNFNISENLPLPYFGHIYLKVEESFHDDWGENIYSIKKYKIH